jgi:hypothetical protein
MNKPTNVALKDRGVKLRPLDLKGSHADIVAALKDIEILVSAIGPNEQLEQIPLADAAKEAGVKRCKCFIVSHLRDGLYSVATLC